MPLNYNVLEGAPGLRLLPQQLHPTARSGGLMMYPFSSVMNGLASSMTLTALNGVPAVRIPDFTAAIAGGNAYLDGEISTYSTAVNGTPDTITISGDPANTGALRLDYNKLVFGYNDVNIFLNPTRLVIPWTAASLPTSTGGTTSVNVNRLNGNIVSPGDLIAHSSIGGDYLSVYAFYVVTSVAAGTAPGNPGAITLAKYDPSFAPPTREGRMRTWGNQMQLLCRAANLSTFEEPRIFIGNKYPPYVNSNSQALLRDPASLALGTLRMFVFKFPIEIRLDLIAGVTSVPLDPETATILAATSAISVRGKVPSAVSALGGSAVAVTISGNNLVLGSAPASSLNNALCEIVATFDATNATPVRPWTASAALSVYTPANNFV